MASELNAVDVEVTTAAGRLFRQFDWTPEGLPGLSNLVAPSSRLDTYHEPPSQRPADLSVGMATVQPSGGTAVPGRARSGHVAGRRVPHAKRRSRVVKNAAATDQRAAEPLAAGPASAASLTGRSSSSRSGANIGVHTAPLGFARNAASHVTVYDEPGYQRVVLGPV